MNGLLRLFMLRLCLLASLVVCVVSFFWAYPFPVVYLHKGLFEAFVDSWWNWLGFVVSFVFVVLLSLVENNPVTVKEKKKEDVEKAQVSENDGSVTY